MGLKKIAVVGASGFIGRQVLAELGRHPVEVIAAVRDATKLENVAENVHVVKLDLADPQPDAYEKLLRPDVVIHLSWECLVDYTSVFHFETELPRQYAFLRGLVRDGLPALLVTGTCLEYGMQSGELSEEMTPLPCTPYGYAKDALRRQLEFLRKTHPFGLTWARLFFVYGEGQPKNFLLSQLKKAVEEGNSVFNMSRGDQMRDYLPVDEVARLLVILALKHADAGVVNVCAGKPISVRSLVEGWLKENNWNIKLNLGYYGFRDYEPMAFWGRRQRLDKILEHK